MPLDVPDTWTDPLRTSLSRYDADLLRLVAGNLLRLRQKHSSEELIDKLCAVPGNAVTIDRSLKGLDSPALGLLALIGLSRWPSWRLHGLLELSSCLGATDGLVVVRQLFEAGLLCSELADEKPKLKSFDDWLSRGGSRAFAHPLVTARALRSGLPKFPLAGSAIAASEAREADGLTCFLRLGILWQQVRSASCRLTQQGEFFKRDQERLQGDPLLNTPLEDGVRSIPCLGHFLVSIGLGIGVLRHEEGQMVAGDLPACWQDGLAPSLEQVWAALPELDSWNAAGGWTGLATTANPYATAGLVAVALLASLPHEHWVAPEHIGRWIAERHCYWRDGASATALGDWAETFLLGVAYQLRLVQTATDDKQRALVRLSAAGRAVLGLGPMPVQPEFPKTLLVQPNLEIVAYRQGLSPGLIGALSRFANWTGLGAACTLQLQPDSAYRGLETGCDLELILRVLQQRGVREIPDAVSQSLRTWANKRERLTVYTAATLLEFATIEELEAALSRGLPGLRISDRLVLVANESDIDYRQFRLLGTRDYGLPPGQCVEVAEDGVTLTVDLARADLLLEPEMTSFAEPLPGQSDNGQRAYRLTPASLARARAVSSMRTLEEWFPQRTGQPLPPAARLLFTGPDTPSLTLERRIVLEVPDSALADGLLQWPETRGLIECRLGPCALVVAEKDMEVLRRRMHELGLLLEDKIPLKQAVPPQAT